jgi:TolB protein
MNLKKIVLQITLRFFKFFNIFLLSLFTQSAFATLDLELTQGISGAIPIAIVPFKNTSDASSIASIISQDLTNSGLFNVRDQNDLQQQPGSVADINYSYWRNLGVDNLVIGESASQSLNLNLIDIYKQLHNNANNAANTQGNVLLSQRYDVGRTDLRKLAHQISNAIYQKLTGKPGFFTSRIAYVVVTGSGRTHHYRLEVSDYDGYNPKILIESQEPLLSPSWSSSARELAFVAFENHQAKIFAADVTTGKLRLITASPGINSAPAWSPRGDKLAIVLSKTGVAKLYSVALSSGQLTQLTDGASIDTEPTWSPDGSKIAFTSNRGGSPQIYTYNLNSSRVDRVTFNGNYNASASYTPDGKSLILLHRQDRDFNIARYDLASGSLLEITRTTMAESPSISPDGRMVIYAMQYGEHGVLGMASIDGKVQLRLPEKDGNVQEPAWSPSLG